MTTDRTDPSAATPAAPASTQAREWSDQAADTLEQVVSTIRDKAVVPAQRATSAVVFGLLAFCFLAPAVVLLMIGGFRLVDRYLPGGTWATWLLFGGIFVVAGAFVWSKRHPRAA